MPRLILLLLPLLAFAACGGDSGDSAPTAPPPPHRLSWADVPDSETLKVGEQKEISLSLSGAVIATYSHSASNANVEVAGESLRAGIYRLRITGVEPGEAIITVTATVAGYETATATFPVMVDVRPLVWTDVPESATVRFGEETEISLSLSQPVTATYTHSVGSGNVEVTGASPQAGIYRLQVTGVEPGESSITVTAMAAGYETATATFPVMVDVRPLVWTDVPESATVRFGEETEISLSLSQPVTATYTHSVGSGNVEVTGASPQAGIYRLQVTGVEPGETNITVTAMAAGYQTATATFPVMVEVRPLAWTDIPESATVRFGEKTEVSLSLSEPVTATYSHSASNANVDVAGESLRAGIYRLRITGVEPGEATITVTAAVAGYETATARFPVMVEVRPLAWTEVPESEVIEVGERKEISLALSAPVDANFTHSARNAIALVDGESPRAGVYRLRITGVAAGETTVTVTAMAHGHETATAMFPLTVELRTLEWALLPDGLEVEVAEQVTAGLKLNRPVLPELGIELSDENVSASAECVIGACEITVTGLAAGASVITVTATADGYIEATGEIEVFVEDRFDPSLWRELVFDAFDCPSGFTDESCRSFWGDRPVEERITAVLPAPPDFHILTRAVTRSGTWRFTSRQIATIEEAVGDAMEQLTGTPFRGRITTGTRLKDEYGWVDVIPLGNAFWEGRPPCGAAAVGATEGLILINTDRLDDCDLLPVTMHEVGHALGFYHVLNLGDYLMSPLLTEIPAVFTETEQFHARLAIELGRGARYTADPRKIPTTFLWTTDAFSTGPVWSLEDIPLEGMIQCPLH